VNVIRFAVFGLLIAFGISACSQEGGTVGDSEYAAKIIGNWLGTVGDMKESISFSANGAFVSEVRPRGFISNTLGQGVTGTIRGKWAIKGRS
jgi:hypothetical protein